MDALLLAAGLGTRLRPLTNDRPKALVTIDDMTLLEINIRNLSLQGFNHIIVNVYHFAEKIKEFLSHHTWNADVEISDESDLLLDTGGAIKKAAPLLHGNTLLVYNVDILSSVNLKAMLQQHRSHGNAATLAVSHRSTDRLLLIDNEGLLCGWQQLSSGTTRWAEKPREQTSAMAFSGITYIERPLIDLLPEADHPYPIFPEYLRLATTLPIGTFEHPAGHWLDVGKPETLAAASNFMHSQLHLK